MRPGLYQRILLTSWHQLDERVRALHCDGRALRAEGILCVLHGPSRLGRLLLWLFGMPEQAESVFTYLDIMPSEDGEKWVRRFGNQTLVSTQWQAGGELLAERFRWLELVFRLRVVGGTMVYEQMRAALRCESFRFRVPGRLAPTVSARESAGNYRGQTRLSVQIELPLIGLWFSYSGTMTRIEGP